MCGIAGYINLSLTEDQKHKISKDLAHRGPDSFQWYENNNIQLLHRRLSILDLSDAANQPMFSANGRYVMVYNGEVYNYLELKKKYSIQTKTTSDSEVILELFNLKGVDAVSEFNGMFAIALYDLVEDKLYLIRDRVGIKPLYYYHNTNSFAFSSELKSLSFLGNGLNHEAISSFLHLSYIPGPLSIYANIYKFPSGSYACFHNNELEIKPYWSVENKLSSNIVSNEKQAKQQLEELLFQSVQYRLISDVPIGTFLSGGIDSSLVTAIANQLSSSPVNSFSIGFKEKQKDESIFARQVATHIGTNHHEFLLEEDEALHISNQLIDMFDEPFADSSAIPTYLVSQKTKEHATVALSGDGGDELFLGYGMHHWAKRLSNPLLWHSRLAIYYALNLFGDQRLKRGSKMFNLKNKTNIHSHIFSTDQNMFSKNYLKFLLNNPQFYELTENINSPRKLTAEEKQSFFDIQYYLKDDLLVKVDRASMANSLEVRVPLLDHNIVEFALNLNKNLKIKQGSKYLLKQILYQYVPKQLFDRPKQGFSIPLGSWMKNQMNEDMNKYLSREHVESTNVLSWEYVKALKQQFENGKPYVGGSLWAIYQLQKWLTTKYSND